MAVRPLVTTGVALVSAGAVVAGTPALFVPRDELTIAASSATTVEAHRTLTKEQILLLAFTPTGAVDAFFNGYGGFYAVGGVPQPTTAVVVEDGPDAGNLVDQYGTQLYVLDDQGNPVRATEDDLDSGPQFYNSSGAPVYVVDENGDPVLVPDPGNCGAEGAVCQDGFTGLAYYATDQLLPFLGPVDNIFYEAGFTEFARLASVAVAQAIDEVAPRLTLERRVDDFFEGGITQLTQNLINDNLPDGPVGTWAKGLNDAFFEDGITGAVTYVVNTVLAVTASTALVEPEESGIQALSAVEDAEGPGSAKLPNVGKLLSLPTPKPDVDAPWTKLTEKPAGPTVPKLLKEEDDGVVSETVEGGTEGAVMEEETKLQPLKVVTPKVELPELDPPKLTLDFKSRAKEAAAKEEDGTKSGNKVAPSPNAFESGKPAGDHNGKKFLNKLKDAVDKATGGGEKDSRNRDK